MPSPLLQLFLDFAHIPKKEHAHWHNEFERQTNRFGKVSVEHSGQVFHAVACDPTTGERVWPIEEYLARSKHKKTVAERIARLNPYGKLEGERVRGVHPKFSPKRVLWRGDLVSLAEFRKKWGDAPVKIAFKRGRHKFVSRHDFMNQPALSFERVSSYGH